MAKIKEYLTRYQPTIMAALIVILVALAAFQLGRLSVQYSDPTDFRIIDPV